MMRLPAPIAALVAISVMLLVAAPVAFGQGVPAGRVGPGPLHKIFLEASDLGAVEVLRAAGCVRQEIDYGAFRLLVIDEWPFGGRERLLQSGLPIRDEHDLLPLNGYLLDGTRPAETLVQLDPLERIGSPDARGLDPEAGLYLVQFVGPIQDAWYRRLEEIGAGFFQYVAMNAYVVRLRPEQVTLLEALAQLSPEIQYAGVWQPAFRIAPLLRRAVSELPGRPLPMVVQVVDGPGARSALDAIAGCATEIAGLHRVGPYVNVRATIDSSWIPFLASRPAIFALELAGFRRRQDEVQGQIMAGNVAASVPTGPGYLAWLAAQGFAAGQFTSFAVNVVDDAYSLAGHPDLPASRVAFVFNPTGQTGAQPGHGFLNAHIVAGFNALSGSAYEDAGGYNYGLGVAPWARVGATAIFGSGSATSTSWESNAWGSSARISSNSWGFGTIFGPITDYDSSAQEYDYIVRDARGAQAGNQELAVIFSAGNDGPSSNTVSTPGTAKNVLTVGASENVRTTGTDGCGTPNSEANDLTEVVGFSSRGPVDASGGDGRWKPEIVAPGTHIQAGVPQSNYDGSGVCNQYWPSGQTLYGWSSGTSHSAPAVAGAAALLYQDFLNQALTVPSPALQKAWLLSSATYMSGVADTLPSNTQGMGRADLGRGLDDTSRIVIDQSVTFGATGQSHAVGGSIADVGKPLRVTLAWTDAPGPTTGAPWVNDLDLEVTAGGVTYKGNVFSAASSQAGGLADFRNNCESVFLPVGISGNVSITVTAAAIAGDGIPGNGDPTDQDFALVAYNLATGAPGTPIANFSGTPTSGSEPLVVSFTDLSSGNVSSWSWSFGDTATSTLQSPSHTYATAGIYSVSLTVSGPSGSDSVTKTNYITVVPPPGVGVGDGSFELQTAGAPPAAPWSVIFGSSHVIDPAGGTVSDGGMPSHGSQWAELSAEGSNAATPPSNPGGAGTAPFGGAGISQTFSYAAGTTVLAFDAAFVNAEGSPSTTFNDWMSVDVSDGATTYNLYYADTFSPTPLTSAKFGDPMTALTAVSVDLAVSFPTSTPSTVFTLTAQVGNGGDDLVPSHGYVDDFVLLPGAPAAPVADFVGTPLSGIAPLQVSFTDLTVGAVTSWSWVFGDGASSTLQNPVHTYVTAGTYTVLLTVMGPGGNDVAVKGAYVTVTDPPPVADFSGTPLSGVAPLTVSFTDLSAGPVTSWNWNFGDGGSSTQQNPSHGYAASGTYNVSLTVIGPGGSDIETKSGYVTVSDPPPVADFSGTPLSGVAPLTVSFTDLSTGPVTSWSWSFGDGGSSTQQNPSHGYAASGTYSVSLTVTGPGGSDIETKSGYVTVSDPPPVADFTATPLSGAWPLPVSFSDLSTGAISTWSWDFGDGGASTASSPSHTYTAAGTYTVALTVTGPGGMDTETKTGLVSVSDPDLLYLSLSGPTTLPGLGGVSGEDIVALDPISGTWVMVFDGSDVGLGGADVSAFALLPSGDIAMSFGGSNLSVAGLSGGPAGTTVTWHDIVSFAPTSLGTTTAGTFSFLFDGSDVGLDGAAEAIDGLYLDGASSLLLSLKGPTRVPGMGKIRAEDVVLFWPLSLGAQTEGTWSLYFDGSDLGLDAALGGDVDALSLDGSGNLLFSTLGSYVAGGSSGDPEDVSSYAGSFGWTCAGTLALVHDLSSHGLPAGAQVDGAHWSLTAPVPPQLVLARIAHRRTGVPWQFEFPDQSVGSVTTWLWDFGDGGTSTLKNPTHAYTARGIYTVTLTVSGPAGGDTATLTLRLR